MSNFFVEQHKKFLSVLNMVKKAMLIKIVFCYVTFKY